MIRLVLLFSLVLMRPVMAQETIRISYNSDWPPYSFGVGQKVQGVLPDLMTYLFEEKMGMKVVQGGFPWVRAQEVVKAGQYDAMVTFPSSTRLEYSYGSLSTVYHLRQRPVVAKGSAAEKAIMANPDVKEFANFRICAMMGDGWSKNFYNKHKIEFRTAKDTQGCLRLVANGRMDVFLHMDAAAQHNMRLSNTTEKLHHLSPVLGDLPFTLLVSKKMSNGSDLVARFDNMIARLQEDGAYKKLISRLNSKTYITD